jgi:hypothetical protein
MPRIAGRPPPVTRPSASRPERLGRPGLSRPPAGLRQWRTIAGARCSPQWTGRGNRKSTRARRSPRKLECRRQCLPARRRKFGGIHPALQSQRHRAVLCRKSSAPRNRALRPRSAAFKCRDARASLAAVTARRRRRRPGASRRHAGPCVAGRRGNARRPRLAGGASAPGRVRSGYLCTGRQERRLLAAGCGSRAGAQTGAWVRRSDPQNGVRKGAGAGPSQPCRRATRCGVTSHRCRCAAWERCWALARSPLALHHFRFRIGPPGVSATV